MSVSASPRHVPNPTRGIFCPEYTVAVGFLTVVYLGAMTTEVAHSTLADNKSLVSGYAVLSSSRQWRYTDLASAHGHALQLPRTLRILKYS